MQQADSSSSATEVLTAAISRALIVFIGGSVAGFLLLDAADRSAGQGAEFGGFFERFGDALSPTAAVSGALGNTMYLAAVAIFIGVAIGAVFGGLARVRAIRAVIGPLAPLALAAFAPGFLLLPIAWAATTQGTIPVGPLADGASFADSLPFVAVWGGLAGLSLVPGMAARIASGGHRQAFGGQIASASLAARTDANSGWRIGFPTTAFLVALTAVELLSGHRGLLTLFRDSLERGAPITSFEIIVLLVAAGAIVAAVIDATGVITAPPADSADDAVAPGPIRTSRLSIVLFGLLAVAVIVAGAGYGLDAAIDPGTDPGIAPFDGGPWLGTDAVGRSLATTMAQAIGPSLVFSFLAATVAAVLGLAFATLRHLLPSRIGRLLGTLIDVFWWPTVLFFPLISSAFGTPERPEIDPGIVLVSGLALMPLTSRLFGKTVLPATSSRSLRALSVWLFTSAAALSIHLVASFMAPFGNGDHQNLGRLLADGFATYESQSWPFLLAALVGTALLATQYYLAAALAAPARATTAQVGLDETANIEEQPPHPVEEGLATVADAGPIGISADPVTETPDLPEEVPEALPGAAPAIATLDDEVLDPIDDPDPSIHEPAEFDNPAESADNPVFDRDWVFESTPSVEGDSAIETDSRVEIDSNVDDESEPIETFTDEHSTDEGSTVDALTSLTVDDWTELGPEPEDIAIATPTPPTRPTARRRSILEPSDPPTTQMVDNPDVAVDAGSGRTGSDDGRPSEAAADDAEFDGDMDLGAQASRTIELRPSTVRIAVAQAEAARNAQEVPERQMSVPPPDETTGAGQSLTVRSVLGSDRDPESPVESDPEMESSSDRDSGSKSDSDSKSDSGSEPDSDANSDSP